MASTCRLVTALVSTLIICSRVTVAGATDASEDRAVIYPDSPSRVFGDEPIRLWAGPHLLLDEFLIESSSNLVRRVNVPMRDPAIPNPLVTGREDGCFQPYLTVVRDPESRRFRLWYGVHTKDLNPNQSHIGYLESEDGMRWIRPHRVLSDPAPIQFGVSVIDEGGSHLPATERYKFAWYHGVGLRVAASPDGLRWTPLSPNVVLPHNHDINSIFWDPLRKHYLATVSCFVPGPKWSGTRRVTKQSASSDLVHWSEPWFVLTPNDALDEGETQFYAMDGYLVRGEVMVGMVKVLRDDLKADEPPDPPEAYGVGYTALAWTRDGTHWTRDREKFLDRDPRKGAWDHSHAWIDEQVLVGDDAYLYYAGYQRGHKVNRFEERQIGLLRMKRDRYVAREAGPGGGSFRTPLLMLDAASMTLNLEAPSGEVAVQILDRRGKPLRGFTRRDCRPVSGDTVAAPVQWRRPLKTLKGEVLRLEFFMTDARLFAFDLLDGPPQPGARR